MKSTGASAAPLLWNISTAAKRTGLTPRAIRHYEGRGLLTPARDSRDARRYGPGEIVRLKEISQLRRCGFTINEIFHVLETADRRGSTAGAARVLEVAQRHLQAVVEQRRELDHLLIQAERIAHASSSGANRADPWNARDDQTDERPTAAAR